MSKTTRDTLIEALSAFLVAQPTALAKLLLEHVDDGRGGCRVCAVGAQHGQHRFPCTIHVAAVTAAEACQLAILNSGVIIR